MCFYYDEKYVFGHKCKALVHVLIVPDSKDIYEEEDEGEISTLVPQSCQDGLDRMISTPDISLHAMSGVFFQQTLKFKGSIGNLEVCVLVAS